MVILDNKKVSTFNHGKSWDFNEPNRAFSSHPKVAPKFEPGFFSAQGNHPKQVLISCHDILS
jgi:hypothetical protein